MEALWIFCEPQDGFNAELNEKKKAECIILKLKEEMFEGVQSFKCAAAITPHRGQCWFRMLAGRFKQRIAVPEGVKLTFSSPSSGTCLNRHTLNPQFMNSLKYLKQY